jgi:hypothetical protein
VRSRRCVERHQSSAVAASLCGETVCPIMAAAGPDRDLALVDAELEAVAVPLDLVHPPVAGRHVGPEGCFARLHEGWERLVEQLRLFRRAAARRDFVPS